MKRPLPLILLVLFVFPSLADAASVRVRPGLWEATTHTDAFQLPVRLDPDRPGVAIVPTAEWRPLAACMLAHQADLLDTDDSAATLRCARVQALALEQARSAGKRLSDDGARWLQWHRTGDLGDVIRTTLAPEVALAD